MSPDADNNRKNLKTTGYLLFFMLCLTIASCRGKEEQRPSIMSGAFEKHQVATDDDYDIESIRRSGEMIIATISSPETYYEYRGIPMGLQYALAERFAASEGFALRVEIAKDTTALMQMLVDGEADLVVFPVDKSTIRRRGCVVAGFQSEKAAWAVRDNSPQLARALNDWYDESMIAAVKREESDRIKRSHTVTRRAKSVFLSRDRGVISVYDNLFKDASSTTGWDWKLIAAQCYQESAFDPNARSYVGAQGLMQIMPSTARELGLKPSEAFLPEKNIHAAARYIVQLSRSFDDIRDPQERIKFVLASYNGGARHVRDAMALARKYGHNPSVWDDVAPYILGLQQPRYYRDPVVKYGYMIGSETANYVHDILERWRDYGGRVAVTHAPQLPHDAETVGGSGGNSTDGVGQNAAGTGSNAKGERPHRKNRFTTGIKVMRPDDPAFNQMGTSTSAVDGQKTE